MEAWDTMGLVYFISNCTEIETPKSRLQVLLQKVEEFVKHFVLTKSSQALYIYI